MELLKYFIFWTILFVLLRNELTNLEANPGFSFFLQIIEVCIKMKNLFSFYQRLLNFRTNSKWTSDC
jgi:hypothetical protein